MVLAAAIVYFLVPWVRGEIGAGEGIVLTGLYVIAAILCVLIIPFFVMWFLGFLWWLVKPRFRAWHINHIRANRLLKEAAERGKPAL